MSQQDVYEILCELGGEATTEEIRQRAAEKFPERSLHLYVTNRLNKLRKWGAVERREVERDVEVTSSVSGLVHRERKRVLVWRVIGKY